MKVLLISIALLLVIGGTGCSYFNRNDEPHLELIPGPTSRLNISNFSWSYGTIEFNRFNGDFDKLDEQVYDLLLGRVGFCSVYMEQKAKDKYGNDVSTMLFIGNISMNELSKYKDWHYWQKDAGIKTMLYAQMNKTNLPSTAPPIDTIPQPQSAAPTTYKPATSRKMIYGFSEDMLYPLAVDQANLDTNVFIVDGVIATANFDSGAMQIQTAESGLIDVQFYPMNASSDVQYRLRIAIAPGNKIRSECARAGASTMDLVSCEITANNNTVQRDTIKK